MYLGFLTIICLLLSSGSNAQTNYVVSGATGFLSQLNGVYVEQGTCYGKPVYVMTNGGDNYSIAWDGGDYWKMGKDNDPQNVCEPSMWTYINDYSATPPATTWNNRCRPYHSRNSIGKNHF